MLVLRSDVKKSPLRVVSGVGFERSHAIDRSQALRDVVIIDHIIRRDCVTNDHYINKDMQIRGDTCISCIFQRYCHFESREGSGKEELKRFAPGGRNIVYKSLKITRWKICSWSKLQVTGSSNGRQV